MPVFIAFAAFLLLIYGHRYGFNVAPWLSAQGLFKTPQRAPGQKSGVRTEMLEMVLEHDTGRVDGRCLKGRFADRTLASLSERELSQLLDDLQARDSQGAVLLETYLDRRCQGWRDRRSQGSSKSSGEDRAKHARGGNGRMSASEAYDVLGLAQNAPESEIRAAHRRLMMKLHPDQGGSTYLASRINEAKDVLLRRR